MLQESKKLDVSEVPRGFLCPITDWIMKDPVIASDGTSYERAAIELWLSKNNTSPVSRALLTKTLTPNINLRQAIEEYLEKRPILEQVLLNNQQLSDRINAIETKIRAEQNSSSSSAVVSNNPASLWAQEKSAPAPAPSIPIPEKEDQYHTDCVIL